MPAPSAQRGARAVRAWPLPRCARQRRRAAQTGKGHTQRLRGRTLVERDRHWRSATSARPDRPGRLDAASCCVMSCFVQTCSRSARAAASCHAPYRRVSNRIEPELATASRDLRMNGATARKDAGGAVAGAGALEAHLEDRQHRAERRRPHHRSRDPAITAPRARTSRHVSTRARRVTGGTRGALMR